MSDERVVDRVTAVKVNFMNFSSDTHCRCRCRAAFLRQSVSLFYAKLQLSLSKVIFVPSPVHTAYRPNALLSTVVLLSQFRLSSRSRCCTTEISRSLNEAGTWLVREGSAWAVIVSPCGVRGKTNIFVVARVAY